MCATRVDIEYLYI